MQAAHDKGSDLADLLEEEYEDFRDALHDLNRDVRRKAHRGMKQAIRMKNTGVKRIHRTAGNINEQVHDDPWPSIGITAGGAFIAGLLLGLRKK
jgi:ElaB/YqjD/DUF883 family membrane-anchored ribosome-binding protein